MPQARGRILALDLGSRRIGLALSDELGITAQGLPTLHRETRQQDLDSLRSVVTQRQVEQIVVGHPVNMNGSEGPRCQSTRAFVTNLLARIDMPVSFWDERLSTAAVERVLIQEADLSRKRRNRALDKMAAAFILQGALDRMKN